jgi:7-cyano-7-deazaguanine synthase
MVKNDTNRAVVLLSGGIDSATTLLQAKANGYEIYALSLDYGQRHKHELTAARRIAEAAEVAQHLIVPVDLRGIGGSALTSDIEVPRNRELATIADDIPVTYVPARNAIFLSIALAWAESLEAPKIFIGANSIDYSGYPDCRPEFIDSFERTANLATRAGVKGRRFKIEAPLIDMTKAEIIRLGKELGLDFRLTHSCYDPDSRGRACGQCDSCQLRHKGFVDAGIEDPTEYVTAPAV